MRGVDDANPPAGVGWHRHGERWVWGVCILDGCAICDAAWRWMTRRPGDGQRKGGRQRG